MLWTEAGVSVLLALVAWGFWALRGTKVVGKIIFTLALVVTIAFSVKAGAMVWRAVEPGNPGSRMVLNVTDFVLDWSGKGLAVTSRANVEKTAKQPILYKMGAWVGSAMKSTITQVTSSSKD